MYRIVQRKTTGMHALSFADTCCQTVAAPVFTLKTTTAYFGTAPRLKRHRRTGSSCFKITLLPRAPPG